MVYWDKPSKGVLPPYIPTFEVKPWREIMPKALADAKKADRKRVEARIGKGPKHQPATAEDVTPSQHEEIDQDNGCADSDSVIQSSSVFSNMTKDLTMTTEQTQAKPKLTQAEREAAIQARIAAKEAKLQEAAAKKAEREAAAAAKREAAEAKKSEREAAAAAKKAEREAREQALKAEGRGYVGSMLSLADRVKQGAYVKGVNGQLRSNDELAVALESCPAENVIKLAIEALDLPMNPYTALNVGQQSMNLRNKLRGALKAGTLTIDRIREIRDNNGYATMEAEHAAKEARKAERKAAAEAKRLEKATKAEARAQALAAKKAAQTAQAAA